MYNQRFSVVEIEAEYNFFLIYDNVRDCEVKYAGLFENREDAETRCEEMNEQDL